MLFENLVSENFVETYVEFFVENVFEILVNFYENRPKIPSESCDHFRIDFWICGGFFKKKEKNGRLPQKARRQFLIFKNQKSFFTP